MNPMENKQINLHMDKKRASLVMLFFALALILIGILAVLSIGKNFAQVSSLLRSDYEYSATMRDSILQDDYYQFEAGISYSISPESQTSLNAEILMQTGDSLYTTSVDWNAGQLSKYGVAISDGLARRYRLKPGDLLYSKHIVDGAMHEYIIEQILPEVSNVKSFARSNFNEGLIIMGYDDQYAENIIHTSRVYTNTPIDQLSSSASDMPVNIVYRTDEIAAVVRTLAPYLLSFLFLSIIVSYGAVYFFNREIRHNMRRLIMLGFDKKNLDSSYNRLIYSMCLPAIAAAFLLSVIAAFISGFSFMEGIYFLIAAVIEAATVFIAVNGCRKRLWR